MIAYLVSLSEEFANSSELEIGPAEPLGWAGSRQVWQVFPRSGFVAWAEQALRTRRIVSALIAPRAPEPDKLWLAAEWVGRLVVDRRSLAAVEAELSGWRGESVGDLGLTVYSPRSEEGGEDEPEWVTDPALYRARLEESAPAWVTAPRDAVLADPEAWFGRFGAEDHGGWVTLYDAAPQSGPNALLGNLAALGLSAETDEKQAWDRQRQGLIRLRVVGFSDSEEEGNAWHRDQGFELPPGRFERAAQSAASSYFLAIELAGLVDPTVIIGPGTVFEQLQPGLAQNLAAATSWHGTVKAGEILGVVMPGWCLNRHLPAPHPAPLRPTPLRFAGAQAGQGQVWDDIARRRPEGQW